MKPRLLFIEDDIVQASMIMMHLDDDFEILHMSNCYQAIEELKSQVFDVILTDNMLPNMSGLDFIQYLIHENVDAPAVLLTASNNVHTAFDALKMGAYDFVSKDADNSFLELLSPILFRTIRQYGLKKKATDTALKLQEEKNTALEVCDSMSQGILIVGADGLVTYSNDFFKTHLNPLFETSFNYGDSLEKVLKGMSTKLYPEKSRQNIDVGSMMNKLQNKFKKVEVKMGSLYFDVNLKKLSNGSFAIVFKDITQEKMEISNLNSILRYSPVPILVARDNGQIIFSNMMACQLSGYSINEMLSNNVNALFQFHAVQQSEYILENGNVEKNVLFENKNLLTKSGAMVPIDVSMNAITVFGVKSILFTFVDISSKLESERRMFEANKLTQSIIESSPFSIVATDQNGNILVVSPALENLLGYTKSEVVNKTNIAQFFDPQELNQRKLSEAQSSGAEIRDIDILAGKAQNKMIESKEWTCKCKSGSTLSVSLTASELKYHDKAIDGYVFILFDITEQKRAHEYIKHIAHHDELTGLPNRTLMRDRIQTNLSRAKRYQKRFAVLLLDLDHFKRINDSLGHFAGDELLKSVSQRMKECLRETDTVCRIGGDEFVIILNEIESVTDVEMIVKKVIEAVSRPVRIGQNNIVITFSIGISMAPDDTSTIDDLLRYADIAMYAAKSKGRNNYQFFTSDLEKASVQKMYVEQSLYSAYNNKYLEMHYQPQYSTVTEKIVGFESLIRWRSPDRGMIYPDEFLGTAETSGFIVTLGEWILRQSITDVQKLSKLHGQNYKLAVNISARQFESETFVDNVLSTLKELDFPPENLQLEITESALLHKSEQLLKHLNRLKTYKISIALDDFGTGYSSMSYVTYYPIDTIKIDRSFMDLARHENRTVICAVAAIASSMNLDLVAEGVENMEQVAFVKSKGAQYAQGYYYSKPASFDDVQKLIPA